MGPRTTSPPDILNPEWQAGRRLITPGVPVGITFAAKNVWDERIGFTVLPWTATFRQTDVGEGNAIHVELRCDKDVPVTLETGEELTFIANITSDMSAGLQPGKYSLGLNVSIERGPDRRGTRLGFSMGSFVVVPPEGALDTSVIVDEVREASGIRVTLERLDFSPEQSTVIVFAASLPNGRGVSAPDSAHMPAATGTVVMPQEVNPTSVSATRPVIGVYPDLAARYRVDEGEWQELSHFGYWVTPEGVHRE